MLLLFSFYFFSISLSASLFPFLLPPAPQADLGLESVVVMGDRTGSIPPYSSHSLPVAFSPSRAGQLSASLIVDFSGSLSQQNTVALSGVCTDLPVTFTSTTADLRTCLFGKTYAVELQVSNKGDSGPARASLSLPSAARSFFSLSHRTMLVPAKVC